MAHAYLCACGNLVNKQGANCGCRGTTTQRGYGAKHQRARRHWATIVNEGRARCTRCNEPVTNNDKWDLDHTDDRQSYLGIAHSTCNRRAGGFLTRRSVDPLPGFRETHDSRREAPSVG